MYVEDHVTSGVLYRGVGVCGGSVEYPYRVGVGFLRAFACCVSMDPMAASMVGSTAIE